MQQENEIDLFELFSTLRAGKFVIFTALVISVFIAFAYINLVKPMYSVSISAKPNYHSVSLNKVCGITLSCLDQQQRIQLATLSKYGWRAGSELSLLTHDLRAQGAYQDDLQKAAQALIEKMKQEAILEINIIENLDDALRGTEVSALNILNAYRVNEYIENKQSLFIFGPTKIVKVKPASKIIYTLSIMLGVFIGAAFVLLRKAMRRRNEILNKAEN